MSGSSVPRVSAEDRAREIRSLCAQIIGRHMRDDDVPWETLSPLLVAVDLAAQEPHESVDARASQQRAADSALALLREAAGALS